jgi:hypothetical protein
MAHYYYTPVYDRIDGQRLRSPGSVDAWFQPPIVEDPDTGEDIVPPPVQQFGDVSIIGARSYLDEAPPRFVVRTPSRVSYSDWVEVTKEQIVTDYGSEVV